MRDSTHMFVSFPLPMTGPVGCPVGEPPGGSSETARLASRLAWSAKVAGMAIWVGRSEGKTPSGSGLPPGGISHSSGTRVGPVGRRHHRDHRAFDVDDGNKNVLAISFNGSDELRSLRGHVEIEQDGEAGGRECAHDPEAAPEHEALPKSRAL